MYRTRLKMLTFLSTVPKSGRNALSGIVLRAFKRQAPLIARLVLHCDGPLGTFPANEKDKNILRLEQK